MTLDDRERAARMRAIADMLDQLQRLVDGAERLERELFDASGSRATWFRARLDAANGDGPCRIDDLRAAASVSR